MPRRAKVFTPGAADPDWSDPGTIRVASQLELAERTARTRYSTDPWAFLTECVFTLDQITGKTRPFPPKEHLRYLTELWRTEPLLLVPKSRRMMVTWLFCALNYWLFRYRPGSKIALLARKEGKDESEGSAELVWRCKFIHEHVPALVGQIEVVYHHCRLYYPAQNSEILGVAQGSDQLRQMTLTSVFGDEFGYWEWAYETYVALRPTIEGGGRFTGVSSANPGFFKNLVYDETIRPGT